MVILVGLSFMGTGVTAACCGVKYEAADSYYMSGFLYVKGDRLGISWGEPPRAMEFESPHKTVDAVDEFVADPLPRAAYLNVSRFLQFEIYFKAASAPPVHVELWHGDVFIAGGDSFFRNKIKYCGDSASKDCVDASLAPPEADGFAVMENRGPIELDMLPRGAVLTLKVIHVEAGPLVYGLGPGQASTVRVPTFSALDVLYRIPKYARPAVPSSEEPVEDGLIEEVRRVAPTGLGAIGLGLVASAGTTHRRRALILVLLLVSAGMAGCMGGGGPRAGAGKGDLENPSKSGEAESYIVGDAENETGLTNATHGSLQVLVLDPEGYPIGGAKVSLVAKQREASTDPYGRAQLMGLVPGRYAVHIVRTDFLSLRTNATVEAASITKLDVTLQYVDARNVTERAHRHNDWFDESGQPVESLVILDADVSSFTLQQPARVLPGTVDIEIVFTVGAKGSEVSIDASDPRDSVNDTHLYPRKEGVPFHLRTTWEMTDPGHSRYSYWGAFFGKGSISGAHVKVTIHKGVLPLEPAHPDRWGGGLTVPILAAESATLNPQCSPLIGDVDACPVTVVTAPLTSPEVDVARAYNASLQPRGFVPFDATQLTVRVKANRGISGGLEGDAPWSFFYHDASTSNFGSCDPIVANYDRASVAGHSRRFTSVAAEAVSKDPASRIWEFRIVLAPEGGDPPYALRSAWCFFVAPVDPALAAADHRSSLDGSNPSWTPIVFTVDVTAHKGAE